MPSDCDRSCKDFDGIFDPPGIRTEHDELAGDITGVTDLDRLPDDILTFLVVLAPYVELLGGDYMDDSSIGFDGRHADLGGDPDPAGRDEYLAGSVGPDLAQTVGGL